MAEDAELLPQVTTVAKQLIKRFIYTQISFMLCGQLFQNVGGIFYFYCDSKLSTCCNWP